MPLPNDNAVRHLIVILGDQLTPAISSLANADPAQDLILMVEVMEEATYVAHHKKKIAFLFSAMRHFAQELRDLGWRVHYRTLDETGAGGSFTNEVERATKLFMPQKILVTEPGEWRVREAMLGWEATVGVPVAILDDARFLSSRSEFAAWVEERKQLRMEYFYRDMRRKTGLLMDGPDPEGGRWNYDRDNRKAAKADLFMPHPLQFTPDAVTQEVLDLVAARFPSHFGDLEPFWFAATRADAEKALDHFIEAALPCFGDYQDAMLSNERFLYHSLLSVYMNCGLLDPLAICRKVEAAYRRGHAPLNCAEGYIRQILGWREYVRQIYWWKMPAYVGENALGHTRKLPWFYWSGETDMNCLRAAIAQTKEDAYAHHIQRLMVTGNFALIAGISPQELHEWYLVVYADAYEWVELPNTLGMSQFGDDGLLASKPYAASGAYINRMSDYCGGCRYNVKKAVGPDACPFNSLYWHFLARHREKFERNPRMTQMYRTWDRMAADKRGDYLKQAEAFLAELDGSEAKYSA